ncbi:MAG: hypothetical protein H0V44_07970, partial [Planctomycetes bacterium]|nr:hypothetical protein [Planctomycetota bacterium]
ALIDTVLAANEAKDLMIEAGGQVRRAAVADPLAATIVDGSATIGGGGIAAMIAKDGGGFIDALAIGGNKVIAAGKPAGLLITTVRIPGGTSGAALPVGSFLCRDPAAKRNIGTVRIESIAIESPGPIRATVLVRGQVLLTDLGATLPLAVTSREPAGRMPFSMRVSFYKGTSLVTAKHQIVFTGEPDCDYIDRWSVVLPGLAGARGQLCLEPGVELDQDGARISLSAAQPRLCWAPLASGFALIRHGWENRPSAITQADGSASIDFWPNAAGVFDLRRYAREWAVGESGDTRDVHAIEQYATYAARGLAKSHDLVIDFAPLLAERVDGRAGGVHVGAPARVVALSDRALLVAQPGWYASSGALGPMAVEQTGGAYAELDAMARRRLDYHLFAQDLYRWHGKLVYGFWQSRFGQAHRNDRWDCDYGRWGWSLDDGAGRIGQVLMQEFLRTLDRRYFEAGEAFARIAYDTSMVHTQQHLERPGKWWTAIGCSHRHNVQPFGCPYVGMRGSNPGSPRILHLLTGDGVIADGLDLVCGSALAYAQGQTERLCHSSSSDGQGSAACALLWKYETTGDRSWLDACRTVLDRSGLIPAKNAAAAGYGPGFGLYEAACEYARLTRDADFQARLIETARIAAGAKDPRESIGIMAIAAMLSHDEALTARTASLLAEMTASTHDGLEDEPVASWPGHAGWKTPTLDINLLRDVPRAIALLAPTPATDAWPAAVAAPRRPADAPADWYH